MEVVQAWEVQPFRGLHPPARILSAEAAGTHDLLLRSTRTAVALRGAGTDRPELQVER